MTVIFAVLTIAAFIGGVFTVFKVGAKDGICDYNNVGEE